MTDNFAVWRRIIAYMGRYPRWALLALAGIISAQMLAVSVPIILRDVIDIGVELQDAGFMLAAGLLVAFLGLLRGVTAFFSRYFGEKLSHYAAYDLRNAIYDKVQSLPATYHDQAQIGTIVTRAISDVNEIQRYLAFGLIDGLNTALLLIGVSLVMFASSPPLAIAALVPMIPLAMLSRNFALDMHPRWMGIMDRIQTLSNHIQENALGAEVVRVFTREGYEIQTYARQNEDLFQHQLDFVKRWTTFLPISAFIAATSTAVVLLVGGWMAVNEVAGVTVGMVVSFNAYVLLIAQPIRFLGFVILLTTQAVASGSRVFEILDEDNKLVEHPDAAPMLPIEGRVRFENVSFKYEGSDEWVLRDINLDAKPGQTIALMGATGSGKTSLVNLIPRFYDVTEGRVTIDGRDVRHVELHSLRKQVGLVLQRTLLFSATIAENIAYGTPEATRDDVIAAAKAAAAHGFISEFPEGYDTVVGERGITLSGGQRQRVAIARALLINPRILILDDATSSVDTQTEAHIQEALDVLMEGRTSFIIAQRLSSVLNADQILILDGGRIVERGTHHELLAKNGVYRDIYRLQMEQQEKARRESIFAGTYDINEDTKRSTEEFRALAQRLGGR